MTEQAQDTTEAPEALPPPARTLGTPTPWDPFQLMDRLDEDAFRKELEGVASSDLVYVVKEGGQEVIGLSKAGVDECCLALVAQGQVIREEELEYEVLGEGQDREALFKVKAARYAVSPAGVEVRLDQVIGVKRQPLYYEPVQLDLDAKVPSKKYRGKTYRELLTSDDGRDYLGWMAENFNEPEIRAFVVKLLNGEDVPASQRGRQLNPHWFEHGAMKAARNARFRLIPGQVRAQVIGMARASGKARVVDPQQFASHASAEDATERLRREEAARRTGKANGAQAPAAPSTGSTSAATEAGVRQGAYAPTEKQVAYYQRLAESPVFTDEERRRALDWLAIKATRQTIKDQIDWMKRQVEMRRPGAA